MAWRVWSLRAEAKKQLKSEGWNFIGAFKTIKQKLVHFSYFFGSLALVALASLLFYRHHFRGLDANALDLAQLARNVSSGQGFTTGVLRPLLLSGGASAVSFPEQTHAPLWSFLLGWIFSFAGARDEVVVAFSFAVFLLAAVLLFVLAFRLSGDLAVAALSACAFGLAPPSMMLAGAGQPLVLSTLLLLALLLVLTPKALSAGQNAESNSTPDEDLDEPPAPDKRLLKTFFIAGILASLCYLNEYVSLLYALPLAAVWGLKGRRWHRKTVIAFALGFVIVALPWWIRNTRLFSNPFYSSQLFELAMNTDSFPGYSTYADTDLAGIISERLRPDAISFLEKIGGGLMSYFSQTPFALPLYLFPFVGASFFLATRARHGIAAKSGVFLALVLLCLGLALLGRVASWQLLPLVPLMAFFGVCAYRDLARDALRPDVPRSGVLQAAQRQGASGNALSLTEDEPGFPPGLPGAGVFALLLIAMVLPPAWSILSTPRAEPADKSAMWNALRDATPEKRVVISDAPAALAWYANRPAAFLPKNPEQIPVLEKLLGAQPTGAIYFSPAAFSQGENEAWIRWQRADGTLANYERAAKGGAPESRLPGALLVRLLMLDEVLRLARARPGSAQVQELLGRTRLQGKENDAALAAFSRASKLQPNWHAPYLGAGHAALRLRNYPLAQQQFRLALTRDRRLSTGAAIEALMGLGDAFLSGGKPAQAAGAYQKILTLSPDDALALNNLAYLYTEKGDADRALEMARRAVTARPDSAPIWDTFGWALLLGGRKSAAVDALRRSIAIAPRSAITQYHLGTALRAVGRKNEGDKALNLAVSIGLPNKERKSAEALLRR